MVIEQHEFSVQAYGLTLIMMTSLLLIAITMGNAQNGCTDPLASNYNINALTNDGSCSYSAVNVSPISSTVLDSTLNETSGLIFWGSVHKSVSGLL